MTTRMIAGKTIQVNDEGFMLNPAEWDKTIAVAIAQEEGVPELTPAHWQVIDFCRGSAPKLNGKSPTLRQITNGANVPTKELFALFAKKVAKIAGLGKPEGCV